MKLPVFLSIGLLATGLVGCGQSEDEAVVAPPPEETTAPLEQAFTSADDSMKQAADMAASALKANEQEKAFVALSAIQASPNITAEQATVAHQSMVSLQQSLAKAAANGDTNAMRIIQLIRSTQPR